MNIQAAITAAWQKIGGLIDGFIVMLPNIILAFIVFFIFFFVARRHRQPRNLGMVLGRLAQGVVP
ncbi:hypothetical protein C7Y66_25290 [Chroococcidiopsis sp. CCALA 051]|nr:hypothetical protein [Chroococcidiopsis sp. CCALA 051]PSM46378.1 hypothetical protein C7Y66_25290 [Chroococcidiopsis sp. CCALA 051]